MFRSPCCIKKFFEKITFKIWHVHWLLCSHLCCFFISFIEILETFQLFPIYKVLKTQMNLRHHRRGCFTLFAYIHVAILLSSRNSDLKSFSIIQSQSGTRRMKATMKAAWNSKLTHKFNFFSFFLRTIYFQKF